MVPRPIKIEGDVAYVTLTKGYISLVDAKVVPLISNWSWRASVSRGKVYASRRGLELNKVKEIKLHRFLLNFPTLEVDHINGNSLDNRLENLRLVTKEQNAQNKKLSKNSKSGYKGVSPHKSSGKWQAQIRAFGKLKYLGVFNQPEEAHLAYVKASEKYHGNYGKLL